MCSVPGTWRLFRISYCKQLNNIKKASIKKHKKKQGTALLTVPEQKRDRQGEHLQIFLRLCFSVADPDPE
jgi:hypothetical protein